MKPFISIIGPTAVGKTDLSLALAAHIPIEIINGDMGQLYKPLSIGTAKPDWKSQPVVHHLFDVVDTPVNYSAYEFRRACKLLIPQIHARGNIPVVVGGSGFYLRSLFFASPLDALSEQSSAASAASNASGIDAWEQLQLIDPLRAQQLHPHDMYRVQRALDQWRRFGVQPSSLKPIFDPLGDGMIIALVREASDLKHRIAQRIEMMVRAGWVDEVASLDQSWRNFARSKGLIGYGEMADIVALGENAVSQETMLLIAQKTYAYARKQRIYWEGLRRDIDRRVAIEEVNLTLLDLELYIKQLSERLISLGFLLESVE